VLAAIKTVKYYKLTADDLVVTVATDGFDRYPSVLEWLAGREGTQNRDLALRSNRDLPSRDDGLDPRRPPARSAGTTKKYYTWVEQQGKTVEALQMQRDPDFWREQRGRVDEIDNYSANGSA